MPALSADPRPPTGEPSVRRPAPEAALAGVFSAPVEPVRRPQQPWHPAPEGFIDSRLPPVTPAVARAPYRPAAPARDGASRPVPTLPEHWPDPAHEPDFRPDSLIDSIPAIPSALQSWPGEVAPADAGPSALAPRRAMRDPSPSRLAYRLNRLWLTPAIRRGITVGLPVFLLSAAVGLWLADDARRAAVIGTFAEIRAGFENRPEFRVSSVSVQSESPEVAQAVVQRLGLSFPVSSFHLDLEALRRQAEALDAVESASVRIRSGGVLEIVALEREPAMVWRHHGGLDLVDAEGVRIARLASREARADLPLIAGEGAPAAIAEARALIAAAGPLRPRLRGLVRMGERRWDVVLDNDLRILLPATGAVQALERVLALDAAQGLLARDVTAVDLRDPTRPTIRLTQAAVEEMNRMRNQATGVRNR